VRFTIDTNILVYASSARQADDSRYRAAYDLVQIARSRDCIITLQSLGELFNTLTRKFGRSPAEAAGRVQNWRSTFPVAAADETSLVEAMDAVLGHQLSFWDAMIWATAKRAGCRLLLSEDGADGRTLGDVTWINPFASPRSPLLVQALGSGRGSR
jgi:predicted nucleic acid-binding protein